MLAVIGLLALENLYRNTEQAARWAIKYFCFGLGAILVYDLFFYADAALFNRIDPTIFDARGFVNAIVVPLIAISISRASSWGIDIHVSRAVVFHSTALMGSGVYLIGMAGAGYYLKEMGGEWGRILQILFLASAAIILFVIFSSAAVKAKVKVWISKHFFSYKYDYREEWLRFTQTIASVESGVGLHDRVVRSVADIVSCDAAGLWVLAPEDQAYKLTVQWRLGERIPSEPATSPFIKFLADTQWIVDMTEYRRDPAHYQDTVFPDWLRDNASAWLVVPLIYRDAMQAFLVLGDPKALRELDWEDYDLLRTVGHQAASYLAEERAMHELSDARRLEDFNRRSAFIVHDIKNIVSQMSLMTQNAKRFGDNPEFQKDMIATVANSVARMKQLLERFKVVQNPELEEEPDTKEALRSIVQRAATIWRKQKMDLRVDIENGADLTVDRERMISVLDHLLQNAIEASGPDGSVSLRQRAHDKEIFIEIEDNGPGMDADYIENYLFRPLESAKESGFGLGAYQTRQLVRELGGRLEVISDVGEGTIMRVILPRGAPATAEELETEGLGPA